MQRRHITVQLLLTIAISSLSIPSLAADKVDTIRRAANTSNPEGSIVTPEATGKVDASSAKPETINGTPEATGKVNASSTTPEAIIGTPDANKKTEAAAEPEWMKAHKAAGALVAQRLFRQAIAQLKPVFEADPTNETLRVDMQKLYMGAALQNLREGKIGDFDELINAGLALKPSPDIEKHFRAVQKEIEPIRALPPEKQTSALLELTKDLK